MLANVNILPVIAAALLHMVIGFFWYSQRFFGKPWMKLMGIKMDKEEAKKMEKSVYLFAFVSALVLAYVFSSLISLTRMRTALEIIELGVWLWLGLVATTTFTNALFTQKPKALWAIDYGYPLVSIIVMSILFTFWR